MIHVAPCSCELHARIRELEAELARIRELEAELARIRELEAELAVLRSLHPMDSRNESVYKARAEKAEAAVLTQQLVIAKAEARVAELEDMKWCHVHARMETREDRRRLHPKPAPAIEGHEREEC